MMSLEYHLWLNIRTILKILPPVRLCWTTVSEMDVGAMAVEMLFPTSIPLHVVECDRWQQRGTLTKCHLT